MNNFRVIIEHDRFSRKPINISFQVSLVDQDGIKLHTIEFKEKRFDYGMWKAEQHRKTLQHPLVIFGLVAADFSKATGIQFDTSRDPADIMEQIFESATTEFLQEYLIRTKKEKDIQTIKKELKKRGELNHEEAIYIGSN